ncbi:zf-TFIIB domain-containing protein [Ideonella sp. BN130291]|uniref:zf-TFIIB domain-containing protein n=1 Tax=Ideonella sp. BN130291 TaxID=3112940 RepID=UPI002E2526BB|nr:zf-TFIIB domain-containing protein [Ideonella sp. BN130291]
MSNINLRCDCPQQPALAVAELAPGLPAHHCQACAGSLLNLDAYREWQASAPAAPVADHSMPLALFETASARACPSCARLMQRHRSGTDPDFRIDRCVACQLVWFDAGEWEALVRAGLRERLVELLADGWQRQLQLDELRAGREGALRSRHGEACMNELARIRAWLEMQPHREELLGLLSAGW